MTTETDVEPLVPESAYVCRDSFIERDARSRAFALVDEGSGRELLDPFDHLESPWLEQQGVVPEADDGTSSSSRAPWPARPPWSSASSRASRAAASARCPGRRSPQPSGWQPETAVPASDRAAVLLLETGGVRLQEANLGLAAVAEACSGVLELRALQPVIAVIAGGLGSFGGMSIVAGLCSAVIMTREARLG
ncbi:hypothetical protein [Frondihabitans sp. PAMC 28766]|uniref:hypothetical protein n=1 Tax=Frondihabitans sp. PAMC 28766 TaxID=1795630 RepID=UPI0019527E1C|nr:hypothetical protein [Frondihabitans sp. PAMC 28766]